MVSSAITTTGATVSWGAVTGASSYTLQYKTSTATTWTTVSGITTTSKALTGLTAGTTYNYQVSAVCTSGTSAYSTAASFTTTASTTVSYCAASGTSQAYEWIDLIKINSINRTSVKETGGYVNTGLTTNLVIGSTNDTIRFSAGFTSTIYTEYWKVYIDFNRNGVFTDAGENVVTGTTTGNGTYFSVFSVPAGLSIGTTRMRVVMSDATITSSCGAVPYGEVEDYTVNLSTTLTGRDGAGVASDNSGVIYSDDTKQIANEPMVSKNFSSMNNMLTVFPNPINNSSAQVRFTLDSPGNMSLRMLDMLGRVVLEEGALGYMNQGENICTIRDLNNLQSGSYILLLLRDGSMIMNDRVSIVK